MARPVLPKLLGCVCGSTRAPRPRRRGTVSNLSAIECPRCHRRAPAAGDPRKIYENWNDMIALAVRREAFKS